MDVASSGVGGVGSGWGEGVHMTPRPGILNFKLNLRYTGAPIVGIARWSVPRIGKCHLEVKW